MKLVLNSHLAVCVFFVLSGDALTLPLFRGLQAQSIHRLVLSRFCRLSVPILASCMLVWGLMRANLVFSHEAAPVVSSADWLATFLLFEPNLWGVIRYGIYGVYFDQAPKSYNPFLWTMSIEMLGSVLVFLNALLYPYLKRPHIVLVCQIIYFAVMRSYLCLFLVGILLGSFRSEGTLAKFAAKPAWLAASWAGLGDCPRRC
jgi:peptidoglycan/LPS O-acetylase OafA/YrhL